jgi:hypothetical protein
VANEAESAGLHKVTDVVGEVDSYHKGQVGWSSEHLEACKHLAAEDMHSVAALHAVMVGVVQCVPWVIVEDGSHLGRLEDGEGTEWREGCHWRWLDWEGQQNRGRTSVRNPGLFVKL